MTDNDRLSGSAKNIGGQVEEGFGRVTGDVKTELRGKGKQMEGTLQDVYGQAKETAADATEAIRERARSRRFLTHDNRGAPLHGSRDCARYRLLNRSPRSPRRLLE